MAELKADQKASLEIFQTHMSREAAAVEWIQKQRENIETKVIRYTNLISFNLILIIFVFFLTKKETNF